MAKRSTPEGVEATPAPAPEKAPKAPRAAKPKAEKAPAAPKAADGEKATRRHFGRNWLAEQIEALFRKAEAGKLPKGVELPLTVGVIRGQVANSQGEQPSTGAISAVLVRWRDAGYIKVQDKPLGFTAFGTKFTSAKGGSLESFSASQREAAKKARADAKAAKAA